MRKIEKADQYIIEQHNHYVMISEEILTQLWAISDEKWAEVFAICHSHLKLNLRGRTQSGAHSAARLKGSAADYYMKNALLALYEGKWTWQYDKYAIERQLIIVIDRLMQSEVERYRTEKKRNRLTILIGDAEQLNLYLNNPADEDDTPPPDHSKFTMALEKACDTNEKWRVFIDLKKQGLSYDEISKRLNCSVKLAYRIQENISRRTISIYKTL